MLVDVYVHHLLLLGNHSGSLLLLVDLRDCINTRGDRLNQVAIQTGVGMNRHLALKELPAAKTGRLTALNETREHEYECCHFHHTSISRHPVRNTRRHSELLGTRTIDHIHVHALSHSTHNYSQEYSICMVVFAKWGIFSMRIPGKISF